MTFKFIGASSTNLARLARRSRRHVFDGFVAILTPDGQPDPSYSATGWKTIDLGGPADFLWAVGLSPDGKTLAFAGVKGVGANPTPATANDDAVLLLVPLAP